MTSPILHTPPVPGRRPSLLPASLIRKLLRRWLVKLETSSGHDPLEQCLGKLSRFNRRYYSVKQRLAILETLQLALYENFYLRKNTTTVDECLNPNGTKHLQTLEQLLEEFIYGYKLLLHLLAERRQLDEDGSTQIQEAIYFALKFLSQRIALAYSQYAAIPKGLWRELHQIFRYAEENDLLVHIIDDPIPDTDLPVFHTGDFIYKRLILLALAEPYSLMQGECFELYYLCSRWANDISMVALSDGSPQGKHIVDMADDRPPRFVSADLSWQPTNGRIIKINDAIHKIERDLAQHAQPGHDPVLSLLDDIPQGDLMQRVLNNYRGKPARACKRFNLKGQVLFAPGINACHHYLMNNKSYTPEMDELKLRSMTAIPRTTDIDPSLFSTQYEQALEKDRQLQKEGFQLEQALQRDVNPLGLALVYQPPVQNKILQVGELIAHRSGSKRHFRWQIGMANWMHRIDDSGEQATYQIGIKNLAKSAIAVAIKWRGDEAQESDYCRGILIPKDTSYEQVRSLIVPSLRYDIDTALTINMHEQILHVRLKRVLFDTRSFTQFEFDVLP